MHYYADDLADMMLEDMLGEVAIDLQVIEHKMRDKVVVNESKALAENIIKHITDFQSEQDLVKMRWTNEELQKMRKEPKIDITYDIQPKAITVENEQILEISRDKYVNPFDLSLNAQQILENAKIDEEQKKSDLDQIQMEGEPKGIPAHNSIARKYKLGPVNPKIQAYRDKYENYLKVHNNTSSKEVWNIYDHIANELMNEQLDKVLQNMVTNDLDKFVEQMI